MKGKLIETIEDFSQDELDKVSVSVPVKGKLIETPTQNNVSGSFTTFPSP